MAARVFLLRSQRQHERRRIARSPARRTAKRAQQVHPRRRMSHVPDHEGLSWQTRGEHGAPATRPPCRPRAASTGSSRSSERLGPANGWRAACPTWRELYRLGRLGGRDAGVVRCASGRSTCGRTPEADGVRADAASAGGRPAPQPRRVATQAIDRLSLRDSPSTGRVPFGLPARTPRWTRCGSSSGARLAVRRAGERRRQPAAFALTLRAPEDDSHRSRGVSPPGDRCLRPARSCVDQAESHSACPLGRLGGRGAGRRPVLVWPFGRAGERRRQPSAFALTLRAPEDDPHRSRGVSRARRSSRQPHARTGPRPALRGRPQAIRRCSGTRTGSCAACSCRPSP